MAPEVRASYLQVLTEAEFTDYERLVRDQHHRADQDMSLPGPEMERLSAYADRLRRAGVLKS